MHDQEPGCIVKYEKEEGAAPRITEAMPVTENSIATLTALGGTEMLFQ